MPQGGWLGEKILQSTEQTRRLGLRLKDRLSQVILSNSRSASTPSRSRPDLVIPVTRRSRKSLGRVVAYAWKCDGPALSVRHILARRAFLVNLIVAVPKFGIAPYYLH